jgi:hypothetical protein
MYGQRFVPLFSLVCLVGLAGVLSGAIVTSDLVYNWDANDAASSGASTWTSIAPASNTSENWALNSSGAKTVTRGSVASPGTSIDFAYAFTGWVRGVDQNGTATRGAFNGGESDLDGDNTMSVELWIKPESLDLDSDGATTVRKQVLFETGGGTRGWAVTLWDDELKLSVKTNVGNGAPVAGDVITHTLSTADIADFIQVVATVEDSSDSFQLYVNPVGATNPGTASDGKTWSGDHPIGTSDAGLGGINGYNENNGFGGGAEVGNASAGDWDPNSFSGYEGEIAIVRVYDDVLSGAEVAQNFGEVVPEPSTFALAAFGLLGLIGGRRRRKR